MLRPQALSLNHLPTRLLLPVFAVSLTLMLGACSQSDKSEKTDKAEKTEKTEKSGKQAKGDKPAEVTVLKVTPVDLITMQSATLNSGPVITGSIQPERKADIRSEVSSVVLQVLKENGDVVKRGDVLVKLDETSIRENLNSAEDNTRSAMQALDQADRSLQRLKTLRGAGMTSAQALDDAEVKRNSAESELSASKARAASARQQLQRTFVRAPFDGVVSDKKVSAGDTAAIGKELLKVIDPTSMRFEGRVSADKIGLLKVGQAVHFRVNGYSEQEFNGKVKRIDPSANDVTRQVEVLVSFNDANQPRVSGLFAEGNIDSVADSSLLIPETSVVKAGDKAYAWQVKDKILRRVELELGVRDVRTGNYPVRKGLQAADVIMRHPGSNFKDGQTVEMITPPTERVAASAADGAPAAKAGGAVAKASN